MLNLTCFLVLFCPACGKLQQQPCWRRKGVGHGDCGAQPSELRQEEAGRTRLSALHRALSSQAQTLVCLQWTFRTWRGFFFCSGPSILYYFCLHSFSVVFICDNAGIGYETALALAGKGYATVLPCRDMNKAAEARDRIRCIGLNSCAAKSNVPACLDTEDCSRLHSRLPPSICYLLAL